MRVAICISGFIRTWDITKRSLLERLVGDIDADYFIHTYKQNLYEFTAGEQDKIISDEEFAQIFSGLNIKGIVIEDREQMLPRMVEASKKLQNVSNYNLPQQESSDSNSISIPIGVRTFDHLRKLYLCNELRRNYENEHNFKYDLVMKTRFDIMYFTSPQWTQLNDNKLHFGYGATWGWPEDTICICSPELMDYYTGRFALLDEICLNPDGTPKPGMGVCSHASLKYVIDKYNMSIGEPAVNINCIRSRTSMQYYGEYRFKCDPTAIYDVLVSTRENDVKKLESIKRSILG